MNGGHGALAQTLHALECHLDCALGGVGVGNLQDVVARRLVVNSRCEHAVVALERFLVLGRFENIGAGIGGIELLHIVVRSAHGGEVVHPDEVGTPLPSVDMREQRGVGGHVNNISIALQSCHERRLAECCVERVLAHWLSSRCRVFASRDMTCILAGKHLRALAAVVVIASCLTEEPLGAAIEVLVNEVGLQSAHLLPSVGKLLAVVVIWRRTRRAHNLYFGILSADGLDELLESYRIQLAPLLVAHANQFQVERSGMSHLCAQFSPLGVGRTVSKLDEVERIVDVRLQFIGRHMCADVVVLELTCKSHAYYWQRFSTYLLRQEEELIESKSVTLVVVRIEAVREGVVPAVLVEWSVLNRTYGVLPLVA